MRLSCQLYACARRAAAVRVYARLPYGKENCIKKILHKTIRGKKIVTSRWKITNDLRHEKTDDSFSPVRRVSLRDGTPIDTTSKHHK